MTSFLDSMVLIIGLKFGSTTVSSIHQDLKLCFLSHMIMKLVILRVLFFISDIYFKNIIQLPNNKFFSHYSWKNDNELLIWTRPLRRYQNLFQNKKIYF